MSYKEWCAETSAKLQQEEQRIPTLNEIKDYMITVSPSEASKVATNLELPLIFDCLNDSNKEQVELACEVLTMCMNQLSLGESTIRYDIPLERALNHPFTEVKLMALKEIERNIHREEVLYDMCKKHNLLVGVVRCLGEDDVGVAKKAMDILSTVGQTTTGLNTILSNEVIEPLQEVMVISEVVRLRVYELVINIAKESETNFHALESTGIINQILDELNNSDVLLRMNIVELLTHFGLTRHGFRFLETNGVLSKLFSLIDNPNDLLNIQLCEPGILRFFGNMAQKKPIEMLSKYPKLFDRIFSNLESGDLIVIGVSLDTLGVIGSTNEGKCALGSTGNKITYAIKTIVKLLPSLPTEVRVRALNCLENLIRVTERKNDMLQITRKWYQSFGDEPMEIILRYAKNPFSEIKLAGLGLLHAIANQQWGQEEIKNTPGLIEYLLDRNQERIKEAKEVKYDIIKELSTSIIFDQNTLLRLQEYVKEGPFYVRGVTEVAFEGND
ncbi:unnamed protein product [Callosobruchus maculatus]|uniref:26S proteasome non-ATPase regulatory subunit 5 n=1 Tax=Callosobruchus maculatus TaxID=64391 RepID=A0A653C6I6_CALMS|nr:unnamed protein product [Callosobruchus maculatus]